MGFCDFARSVTESQSAAFKTLFTISHENLSEQLFVICKTYESQGISFSY